MPEKFKNYQKALDDLHALYKREVKVEMDEEVLHLIIRINAIQKEIKKTLNANQKEITKSINKIEKVQFRNKWDYFIYGIGKSVLPTLIILLIAAISYLIYKQNL